MWESQFGRSGQEFRSHEDTFCILVHVLTLVAEFCKLAKDYTADKDLL